VPPSLGGSWWPTRPITDDGVRATGGRARRERWGSQRAATKRGWRFAPPGSHSLPLIIANDNVTPFERGVIDDLRMEEFPLSQVAADPRAAAPEAVRWARRFERILIHLDVDVLDFADFPIAENDRRNRGLRFDQLLTALRPLLASPNRIGLTVTEVNPDHAGEDESVLRRFVEGLGSGSNNGSEVGEPGDPSRCTLHGTPALCPPR